MSFYCNHLGNVLATVSDRKIAASTSGTGSLEYFEVVYTSYTDYYPFGMMIKERTWSSSSYRFGFQGQEGDDEVAGEGNSYTAEFWQYDSRLGRRWNVDPVNKNYSSLYSTFGNTPISHVDPDGNTDFYNLQGEKIGSDNQINGSRVLILRKSTARKINRATQKKQAYVLSIKQEKESHLIPTTETLKKFDFALSMTKSTGLEWAGAVGISSDNSTTSGKQKASNIYTLGQPDKSRTRIGASKLAMEGYLPMFGFHTHPNMLKFFKDNQGDAFMTVGKGQSDADTETSSSSSFVNVVLEVRPVNDDHTTWTKSDETRAKKNKGGWTIRSDNGTDKITLYSSKKQHYRKDYNEYKSLVNKINSK